jgi:hypothetical protein
MLYAAMAAAMAQAAPCTPPLTISCSPLQQKRSTVTTAPPWFRADAGSGDTAEQ